MRRLQLVIISGVVLGGSMPAAGADIYVDAAAADGGDGSAGMPVQDVQLGLELAQPGDVVHVAAGMYGPIATVRAGTEALPITVVADTPRSAIVQGDGTTLLYAHDWHRFEGLVIDGGYGAGDVVRGDGGNHIALVGVEVRRSAQDCIDLRNSTDITIEDSFIHHCIRFADGLIEDAHGVTGDSVFDLTIRNTEIAMASGDSVQLSPPREPWGNLVIEGCTLWTAPVDDPDSGAPMGTPMGENAFDSKVGELLDGAGANPRVVIRDTVAFGFRGYIGNQGAFNLKENVDVTVDRVTIYESELGFRLRNPAVVRIQNAVVYAVDNAVRYEEGITGVVIANTTVGGEITADLFEDGGGGWNAPVIENFLLLGAALPADAVVASSLAVGPEVFVDAVGHDYRLIAGASPIDAGVALAEVIDDRDGVARPYGAGYDIGAYEWNPDTGADTTGGSDDGGDDVGDGTDADASGDGSASATLGESDGSGTAATIADAESGEGGGSGGDTDDGGCGCRSTSTHASAWMLIIVVGSRIRPIRTRRPTRR